MHESVFSAKNQIENGVSAIDIAKRLIDKGFQPKGDQDPAKCCM
jgi:glycine dehydrogenase subunit 2